MCFFEDNCPALKGRLTSGGQTNIHHFFFPSAVFKELIWQGLSAKAVFYESSVVNHREFHTFFARNCVKVINRKCSDCIWRKACCFSSTQPKHIQEFVEKHCPEHILVALYPSAKPKEKCLVDQTGLT